MGNFFNSEIVGIPSQLPWAVTFLRVDAIPRHPSQLYEALAYVLIFLGMTVVYLGTGKDRKPGVLLGLLLVSVFTARFLLEFLKVKQAAYAPALGVSTGQWLSLPFILAGLWFLVRPYKRA